MSAINSSFFSVETEFHGQYHIIRTKLPFVVLLVCVSCALGALLRIILKESNFPINVILWLIGVLLGVVGYFVKEFTILTEYIAEIDPILFLHMFTPAIIFTAAFETDFYIFRKSFWQMILQKKKNLDTLPSTIASPTAEEHLHSISWLDNEKKQIEFMQKKARILCYDYGDIIFKEHEMPQGIHLIISGMTKLFGSRPYYGVDKNIYEQRYPTRVPYTDYLVSGAIIGELNCLTKEEMEYSVICETAVQTCFISMDDLFEAFDEFFECPSLEYKIWLKLALDITSKMFKENLAYQDWSCTLPYYVMDVPTYSKCNIYDRTMDEVILVHGIVEDYEQLQPYFAPCILPKTCHQVQGTAAVTKLLIVPTTTTMKRKSSRRCSHVYQYHSSRRRQVTIGNIVETDGSSRHSLHSDSNTSLAAQGQSIAESVL